MHRKQNAVVERYLNNRTGKPYTFDEAMKARFGGKVYRLALSAATSCPNRDGTCGIGGCIFCSAGGSGDFAEDSCLSIHEQIERAKARVSAKLSRNFAGYMAYFQSYTGTYGDQAYLLRCFREAAAHEEILALSIATRPDCLEDEMILALADLNRQKPVMVELGLQTIHEDTAVYINRGYPLPVFEDAFRRLKAAGLEVVVHVIIGLPGETAERTKETVRYLSDLRHEGLPIDGIKLQLMHILKGTRLGDLYPADHALSDRSGSWHDPGRECTCLAAPGLDESEEHERVILNDGQFLTCYNIKSYADLIVELAAMLPEHTAIHRMTGDAPKKLLIAPLWSADKKRVLNTINKAFSEAAVHGNG